jgi:uncharacterized protein YegJ (DUF2314 family)
MKNRNTVIFVVVALLVAFRLFAPFVTPSKTREYDESISVRDDDPEMVAAIAKARATLPKFWTVFNKRKHKEDSFALKVEISDSHGTELFWAIDIERRGENISGTIDNKPDTVQSVKSGDRIKIADNQISDWVYMRDEKMFGNFTIRPLFKSMSTSEVDFYEKILAEP